jgi:integrase
VKGRKAYTQPIDARLLPTLKEIVTHRRRNKCKTLCDLPELPSVEWRKFLDEMGIKGVSHHSLRVTWITKAALAGIPESVAQAFSNHDSTAVHRIYQKFTTDNIAKMLERLAS